ncbi:helix-turn-helix transcriptional regulator [Paenibacillus sp. 11B]|uniref:helix-turn-helix domain-containing protein n=1 Tax=unclassified Paenibacillus TaxID=185978 RepID=UPI00265078B7|nr:helix-turn-helix transcriptional regulator [Paenibacillus sp. 11B]MDN8590971.1 helix-turn-helix transcriptional regulator [Paenibacillus sp. 11B]
MPFKITLRAARVNSGMTMQAVANAINKNVDTISKYELDSSNIPHDLMVALLELYNVPFMHIFFGKESEFLGRRRRKNDESVS